MPKKWSEFSIAFFYRKRSKDAKSPYKASRGSFGFDVYANETVQIKPGEVRLVPTGLIVKPVFHHSMIAIVPRSSLGIKKRVIMPNSIGIIDADYCGEDDEVMVPLLNVSDKLVVIEKGERIAQLLVFKVVTGEAIEYPEPFKESNRGGFGSSGGYKSQFCKGKGK